MFLASPDMGHTVPLQTAENETGLSSSKGIQVFVLFIHPCNVFLQGECKFEQPDHRCDATRFSKEEAAKLDRGPP